MDNPVTTRIRSYADVMIAHMPIGVGLYDARDLRLLTANSLFLTSFCPSWHHGRAIGHILVEWLPRSSASKIVAIFRRVVETGIPFHTEEFTFSRRDATCWSWTLDPVLDHNGQVIQLLQTISDATGQVNRRQKAEEARLLLNQRNRDLEVEHGRLRAILDQLPEGVVIAESVEGSISYANAAAAHILGLSVPQFIGSPFDKMPFSTGTMDNNGRSIPLEDFPLVYALRGETINSCEMLVNLPHASNIVLLCSAAPLRTTGETITGAVLVFQDITARKSSEQHKNAFLSIASHELRTPITTIQGFAEILQHQAAHGQSLDTQRCYSAVEGITEQCLRLSHLIEEMLDISRIEHTSLLLRPAPHDLLRVLTHTTDSLAITTKQHVLNLTLEGIDTQAGLMGYFDENRIVQVLNNLISNAIKYSPAGGEIEIGLRRSNEQEALIWVKDYGIGIPASELPLIFRRFHRARSLDHSISGLGIGLYLVNELVTRHGGRTWAESTEGLGSTFYVQLPLQPYQSDCG